MPKEYANKQKKDSSIVSIKKKGLQMTCVPTTNQKAVTQFIWCAFDSA